MAVAVELVVDVNASPAEGPAWDERAGILYWVDPYDGWGVHRCAADGPSPVRWVTMIAAGVPARVPTHGARRGDSTV